jgi:hypothetical protein
MDTDQMQFNLVVLTGKVVAPPDLPGPRGSGSGRLLVTVQSFHPSPRVDLVSVSACDAEIPAGCTSGDELWITGSLQRRFSAATGRSRIEVVAHHIERRPGRAE